MKTTAKDEGYRAANTPADKHVWILGPSIWWSDWSYHLESHRYGLRWESAGERDELYYFEWADAVQEGIVHPLDWSWSLVEANWYSGASETHQTASNPFRLYKYVSWEPYLRINSVNRIWRWFPLWDFLAATYRQCERGISIHNQRQLHSTDGQAQWLVYRSWRYGGDTVSFCLSRLIQYWICKWFQPTFRYW